MRARPRLQQVSFETGAFSEPVTGLGDRRPSDSPASAQLREGCSHWQTSLGADMDARIQALVS